MYINAGRQAPTSAASKLQTQESQWCRSTSAKASRHETQEGPMLQSVGRKKLISQLKGSQAGGVPLTQPFCSVQAFN